MNKSFVAIAAVVCLSLLAVVVVAQLATHRPAHQSLPAVETRINTAAPVEESQPQTVQEEPQKPLDQVITEANNALSERNYEKASPLIAEVLERTPSNSQQAAEFLLKQGETALALGESREAQSAFTRSLAIADRKFGPLDARTLPALRGLIATYDETGETKDALLLVERYRRVDAPRSEEERFVGVGAEDEKIVASIIAAAQSKVAKPEEHASSLASEVQSSIEEAAAKYGQRSYVVALLWLKLADIAEASDDADTSVGSERLLSVMSIIEQNFGPLDSRLAPVLNRLAALSDEQGEHETAEIYIQRLSMLHAASPAKPAAQKH